MKYRLVVLSILTAAVFNATAQAAPWTLGDIQSKVQAAQAEARQNNLMPAQAYQHMNAEAEQIAVISRTLEKVPAMSSATQSLLSQEASGQAPWTLGTAVGTEPWHAGSFAGPGPVVPDGSRSRGGTSYQCPNPLWNSQAAPNVVSTLALAGNTMTLAYALQIQAGGWQADTASALSLVKTHSVADLREVIALITKANRIVGNELNDVAGTLSQPIGISTLPLEQARFGLGSVNVPSSERYVVVGHTNAGNSDAPHCPIGSLSASSYGLLATVQAVAEQAMAFHPTLEQGLLSEFSQGPGFSVGAKPRCIGSSSVCDPNAPYFRDRQRTLANLAYDTGLIRGRLQQLLPGIRAANAAIQQATAQFDQMLAQAGFNTP